MLVINGMGLAFGVLPIHLERSWPRTGTPLRPNRKRGAEPALAARY
jgi:hypothetical protein